MTMHGTIQGMIDKFHERIENDEKVRKEVEPIHKRVNIDLDTERYSLVLDHGRINDLRDELLDDPDITVISKPEHLRALIDGDLRVMRAYMTGKIKVKGKLEDIMHLRKLF